MPLLPSQVLVFDPILGITSRPAIPLTTFSASRFVCFRFRSINLHQPGSPGTVERILHHLLLRYPPSRDRTKKSSLLSSNESAALIISSTRTSPVIIAICHHHLCPDLTNHPRLTFSTHYREKANTRKRRPTMWKEGRRNDLFDLVRDTSSDSRLVPSTTSSFRRIRRSRMTCRRSGWAFM